MLIIFTI